MRRSDTLFLANKIEKQIQMHGAEFTFIHKGEDKYHRPTEPVEISLSGIYHEIISYQQKTTNSGATTHKKASPMILCKWSDGSQVSVGDTLDWSTGEYRVVGIEDVQQLQIACQISLEVISND